jgi:trans-aconitate 2-methyltransferase
MAGPAYVTSDWSPTSYLKFGDERTRAARDLLAQVPLTDLQHAVDMGCGPGNSTELLARRYPEASIVGFDSSRAMLEAARERLPRLRFEHADAHTWTPGTEVDLVFANATYQWIAGHLEQLPRVLGALHGGAVLAVQMPDNLNEPSHHLMTQIGQSGPWASRLKEAAHYYTALKPLAASVDIWRTTYHHVLADAAAIVEFVSSTGLRPFLDPLSQVEKQDFLSTYSAAVADAYGPLVDGKVLLAFPRLFIVAQR